MFAALKPGDEVIYEDRHYRLGQAIDFSHILGHDLESGAIKQLPIRDLKPLQLLSLPRNSAVQEPVSGAELSEISTHDWEVARARHAAIKPLLKRGRGSTRAINEQAVKTGVHRSTIYRWLCAFREGQAVEALRKEKSGPPTRQGRVRAEVETIISGAINEHYLRREKPSVKYAAREAIVRCRNAGLKPPHPTTVRRRVKWIDG